jgi:hypothetical protein
MHGDRSALNVVWRETAIRLGSLYLLIEGGGVWSLDAVLARKASF